MHPQSVSAILEIAQNAFVTFDADGRVVEWNPRAEELFGYSRQEALGRDVAELIVPERYRDRHREGLKRVLERDPVVAPGAEVPDAPGGDHPRLHLEAMRRDGSELPVELAISEVLEADGWRFHAWIQDVSERAELLHELEAQLRGSRPGFAEILDALAEAVTIRDPHDHIIYANRAALVHMGFSSLEELQRRPPLSIIGDYMVHDEHGAEVTMGDIPSVRLMAGQPAEPLLIRTINRATGVVHWNLLKASGLHDAGGTLVAAVTIIEDVTREKTAELQDRFLARATETLMSSLDYEETLGNVARLVVPEIADWCSIDLVDERGSRQRVVVAHRDSDKLELAERTPRLRARGARPRAGGRTGLAHGRRRALRRHRGRDARLRGARSMSICGCCERSGCAPCCSSRCALEDGPWGDDARDRGVTRKFSQQRPGVRAGAWPAAPPSPSTTRGLPPPAVRSPPRCSEACCPRSCRRSPIGT